MARAAGGGASVASSAFASLERTLDRTIECLVNGPQTREGRALLIEARRLRSVVANWRSIPPPPDVHDEMLDRVLQLSTAVGAAFPESVDALPTEIDEAPQILTSDVTEIGHYSDETEAYSLDFEPHLYSLETSATRQAIRPPALTPDAEPRTAARGYASYDDADAPRAASAPAPAYDGRARERAPMPVVTQPAAPPSPAPPPDMSRFEDTSPGRQRPTAVAGSPRANPTATPAQAQPVTHPSTRAAPLPAARGRSVAPPPAEVRDGGVRDGGVRDGGILDGGVRDGRSPGESSLIRVEDRGAPGQRGSAAMVVSAPAAAIMTYEFDAEGDDLSVPRTQIAAHAVKLADPANPLLVFLLEPYSPRADAYRAMRRKLAASPNARVLGITSAHAGEGKTVFALNLALTLRESARGRVLIVEANLRTPIMGKMLGFDTPECFIAQLARHADDPRAPWVVAEPLPKLHVMAIDPKAHHEPLLDPVAFSIGMERLKQAGYDYVIVDSPPVIGSVDCNVISDAVDAIILTALPMKSRRKEMRKAVEQLEPAPILGVVVLEA